jgi:hypothetical protein
MDVGEVIPGRKAGPRSAMAERLQEVLDSYLRYHRIEGSTTSTVKFYAKEL